MYLKNIWNYLFAQLFHKDLQNFSNSAEIYKKKKHLKLQINICSITGRAVPMSIYPQVNFVFLQEAIYLADRSLTMPLFC